MSEKMLTEIELAEATDDLVRELDRYAKQALSSTNRNFYQLAHDVIQSQAALIEKKDRELEEAQWHNFARITPPVGRLLLLTDRQARWVGNYWGDEQPRWGDHIARYWLLLRELPTDEEAERANTQSPSLTDKV